MKKSFACFLLFLFGLSLVAQTETSGRSDLYRHTPEKQTRLIHTCLKVGFDFKNHPNERRGTRYDKGSRLMEDKAWSYRYDAEGNLVQKISKTQSVGRFSLLVDEVGFLTWTYAWNANGSLRSASNNKGVYLSFEYDALGRRTAKINHQTQKIKRFLWDGNVPLHEWEYPLSERPELVSDSNGYLSYVTPEPTEDLTTWIFEEDGFVPIAKLQNGEKFSIFADHLGTPVMAVNSEGKRIWECELDIYGKKRKETGVPDFIPFRYQGQYEDEETGLYYNRFRYYSPASGTYISQDPIGLDGGGRLYGYVHDPNTWIDPLGLAGEFDIGTYGGLKGGTNVGDNLSAHELLQNAWLQHNDNVKRGVGSKSLDNPAIALGENPIHKRIGDLQRKHNLYDKNTLLKQSALENINKNAALTRRGIMEGLIERGMDSKAAKALATTKTMQLRDQAIAHAKKHGYIQGGCP